MWRCIDLNIDDDAGDDGEKMCCSQQNLINIYSSLQDNNNNNGSHLNTHKDSFNEANSMDADDFKAQAVTFSITDSIKKSTKSFDNNNNSINDIVSHFADFIFPPDQNNNENSSILQAKLRNHQMQQLLQHHVFSPHQLQQLIMSQPMMANSKESLFHFEQKRKQMELLMHQIQEQLHANILQQTHLLQQQSPNGEANSKKSSTFQLQQKLAIQQQELAQQFQLIQRQYLLHQSGMQLLFPQHHQQQIQSE